MGGGAGKCLREGGREGGGGGGREVFAGSPCALVDGGVMGMPFGHAAPSEVQEMRWGCVLPGRCLCL